jgi:DNA-directed RNA polymerase specialized sigma24 family protein
MGRDLEKAAGEILERDRDLVQRLRRPGERAVREFFVAYFPVLLREATRLGVEHSEREHCVLRCLSDAIDAIARSRQPLQTPLVYYLLRALRNDVMNRRRDVRREELRTRRAVTEVPGSGEWVVAESCSENLLRSSAGPDWNPPPVTPVLERLATMIDEGITADERKIMHWIGDYVPQRIIAEWLGISHSAARVRVHRLRERLREAAQRYAAQFDEEERRILLAFFRRTAVVTPERDNARGELRGLEQRGAARTEDPKEHPDDEP